MSWLSLLLLCCLSCSERDATTRPDSTDSTKSTGKMRREGRDERDDGSASRGDAPVVASEAADATPPARPAEALAPSDFPHPYDGLSDAELEARLLESPETLGPISLGIPEEGRLINGVQMPEDDEQWKLVKPHQSWGTQETIDSLRRAIEKVHQEYPTTGPLFIGDISKKSGGHFYPHNSHQSGRDVDIGFYHVSPRKWYTKAYLLNLDIPRTWSLIKALITETDVELIYSDRYVIGIMLKHAKRTGEDPEWLDKVFMWQNERSEMPLVRHESGHRTHFHVRFYNPIAQESGRRLFHLLKKHDLLDHPIVFNEHTAVAGDTVRSVAQKFNTTRRAITRFNKLTTTDLTAGQTYIVPVRGKLKPILELIVVPPRLVPKAAKGE